MSAPSNARLPLGALLALAMAGFITILTEALPACSRRWRMASVCPRHGSDRP